LRLHGQNAPAVSPTSQIDMLRIACVEATRPRDGPTSSSREHREKWSRAIKHLRGARRPLSSVTLPRGQHAARRRVQYAHSRQPPHDDPSRGGQSGSRCIEKIVDLVRSTKLPQLVKTHHSRSILKANLFLHCSLGELVSEFSSSWL